MTARQPSTPHDCPPRGGHSASGDGAPRKRAHGGCDGCLTRNLAVCASLPLTETHALEAVAGEIRLAPGGVLAREGAPRRDVHSVTRGMLRRTQLLPDGRRFVVGFLIPGDFIGFSGDPQYRHTIEAITECTLCAFTLQDMRRLCERYPEMEAGLLQQACGELDVARNNLMTLARMTPVERLASFLRDLGARQQCRGGAAGQVDLPMTRADIADHLGLTIETVSRSFSRLKQEGVLFFEHPHHIELRDPVRLRALAGS